MGDVIGQLLSPALGVAFSPLPIVAMTVILTTSRARSGGIAFSLGWALGAAALLVFVALIVSSANDSRPSDPPAWLGIAQLLLGLALLVSAYRHWKGRPRSGEPPSNPAWLTSIQDAPTARVASIGAAMAAVNPKNLPLLAGAATVVGQAKLAAGQIAIVAVIFTVLATSGLLACLLIYFAGGDRATKVLLAARKWLEANNQAILMVLFAILGVNLIGDGVTALF